MKTINLVMMSDLSKTFRHISILILLAALSFISCKKEDDQMEPLIGDAPDFSAVTLDGKQLMLSAYKNKVIVLFFFGNNCPSCKAAAPSVESMLIEPFTSRSDYQVLGLDQWDGNSASVQAFKDITGVSFPLLLNASGIAAKYQTTYDRLVIIDRDGSIVFSGTQGAANDIATVKEKVEIILGPQDEIKGDAPGFNLKSLNGIDTKLADFNNKVVVLFFFGYNCPSCKAASPGVQSNLVVPFESRTDYQVLGLDQWNGNQASVEAFKTVTGVTFPLLLNAAGVASDYKTTYDRLVVIDKKGNIAFSGKQSASSDIAAVKSKVELLLSGK
ncbi:MAG: hypothetical protein A2X03_19405 [Bacteroidetes bacterium GWA2_40_15]|nr:MAG: hypothetical protein A2X03_19405 [Bacteroidetes bacterium GWA2_40_15]